MLLLRLVFGLLVASLALHGSNGFRATSNRLLSKASLRFNQQHLIAATCSRTQQQYSPSVLRMATTESAVATPGSPVVRKLDKEANIAYMTVSISGEKISKAFQRSCDAFNKEVVNKGYSVPGFRSGATLPAQYLYQMFGEDQVKNLCANFLSEDIQDECEITGLMFVGRGRIMDFRSAELQPGQPHVIDIECDLWPEISYNGISDSSSGNGYKGLKVKVVKDAGDEGKMEKVKNNIRERYKILTSKPMGAAAEMGDIVVVNMNGFEKNEDGGKGTPLPAVAQGDQVEVALEEGKFMPGMVESLVGGLVGDKKLIEVTFPKRPSGPGAALSGKQALFEVDIVDVKSKTLPQWNQELATSIREDMTLEALEAQVKEAVESEASSSTENNRNEALGKALMEIVQINKLPESLMEENTQQRFQQMLMDFKEQGSSDEQLSEMMTPEKYQKYKELSRPNVEKIVKLGLTFRDIAEKEGLTLTPQEIQDQFEGLLMQAKQKGEQPPDESAAKDEIENVLLRKKVFNFLAQHAVIEFVDAEPAPAAADLA